MNVLILGGSGFIGHHLINALRERSIDPHVADIKPPLIRNVKYTCIDLCNISGEKEIFKGMDVVYHLAWATVPKTSNDDPVYDVTTNLAMTLNILKACVEFGVKKVIFVSSGGTVYGAPHRVPIDEKHPTSPICSYGITKLMAEKYLHMYHHIYGLDYIVLRPSNPFGEYQNPFGQQGAATVFLGRLYRRLPIAVWGDGSVVRDYLYIGDLADAMVRSLDYSPSSSDERVFNVGSGRGMSLNELIDLISRITGLTPEINYIEARRIDVPANILDISLIKKKLGWVPMCSIEDAIEKTWTWLKNSY